jgi:Zn-dependent protease
MPGIRQGSLHLFRVAGIDLFLHWSWFLVAAIEIEYRRDRYTSLVWSALEYLSLFLIVVVHEFGHALACRQVGGTANRIMLWPLGGVAFVDPPQRPGATLWSIAAGPLVNVALLPLLYGASLAAQSLGWAQSLPDAYRFVNAVLFIDFGLLVFNLVPVYPLDGGQILRSLLWFPLGRGRSLAVATVIGFIGVAGFLVLALWSRSVWLLLISGYMLINCWGGLKGALVLMRQEKLPRRPGFACPSCHAAPPLGTYWRCARCSQPFDTFESGAFCPHCGAQFVETTCLYCLRQHSLSEWIVRDHASSPAVESSHSTQ